MTNYDKTRRHYIDWTSIIANAKRRQLHSQSEGNTEAARLKTNSLKGNYDKPNFESMKYSIKYETAKSILLDLRKFKMKSIVERRQLKFSELTFSKEVLNFLLEMNLIGPTYANDEIYVWFFHNNIKKFENIVLSNNKEFEIDSETYSNIQS